ncbi:MAG: glycosyltransferase [Paracoccaceae bacterium]|nr:glycosyltransferase [Paracoccaceae bacterium]
MVPFEILDAENDAPQRFMANHKVTLLGEGQIKLSADDRRHVRTVCDSTVNGLSDWAVENGKTVQIRILDRTEPCEIVLENPMFLPQNDLPQNFQVGLALHRADAELHLTLRPMDGGKEHVFTEVFDRQFPGGRGVQSYQPINIPLPKINGHAELTISVKFLNFVPEEDNHPYLFLANPTVVSQSGNSDQERSLHFVSNNVPSGPWAVAPMPVVAADSEHPVALVLDKKSVPLIQPIQSKITLHEDHGHTILLSATKPASYRFVIDGQVEMECYLAVEPTWVRLPANLLTGHTYMLSIEDKHGIQTLFQTYIAPPRLLTPPNILQELRDATLPGQLFAQGAHRFDALKALAASNPSAKELAQASYALSVLEGGFGNVKLEPIHFPKVAKPDVSIIIPAHNKVEITYYALCSLLLAHNDVSFEVIVVDDASTDETGELEKIVSGIKVIHNEVAKRFIGACNAGVDAARGKYVVLLNNDIEATAGWLDALVDGMTRFNNVGMVGSKLLYPNGKLQDAGGIIWGTGDPWNYGNNQNPWDPRFSYARQADYLCGAALMTTKEIWDEVGGLSQYLAPMYFEDTDLAFKVRDAGYKTYFIPSSVVYHFEGMTSGTDVSKGFKKHQEENRPKFKRKWARAYASHGAIVGKNPDQEKDRGIAGRVLFIDYTTPRADQDAGSYAAIQEIKLVQALGYKVSFLPQNLAHVGKYTAELEKNGVEVIYAPFVLSVEEFLETRGAEFDAFYVTRYYVMQQVQALIRRVAPHAKIIYNNADLHFLRELRRALVSGDPAEMENFQQIRNDELQMIHKADVVLSYNEVEHAVIRSHTDGQVPVMKCPWVVDIPEQGPAFADRAGLSFLGSFMHHPNLEGLNWFLAQVMPMIKQTPKNPIKLSIYGSKMPDEVKKLESDIIDPAGFVEELEDAYHQHRIFVAPLLSGAGIKGKVIGALAHGVPCVLTPTAAEGIGLRHMHDCIIAETPAEWKAAIETLYSDQALWQKISDNARAYMSDSFSTEKGIERMRATFEAVDLLRKLSVGDYKTVMGQNMRTVILHYHLFKNAGTSVDQVLRKNFGNKWITAEFPPAGGNNSAMIGAWIRQNPDAVAFSTHTGAGPVPVVKDVNIISVMFLRDPIERIKSAYRFETKQGVDNFGSVLARHTDFNGYVRTRLALPNDRQCRNFQTNRLASVNPGPENELTRAKAAKKQISLIGYVEEFDASMMKFEELVKPAFPEFKFEPAHANRTKKSSLMDDELHKILLENNQSDIALIQAT